MDATFLIEISAVVAILFEVIKRLVAKKVTDPTAQDYVFRGLLLIVAFIVASAKYFYFSGHPEILKTAGSIAITASGIWAFFIRLLPKKVTNTDRESN